MEDIGIWERQEAGHHFDRGTEEFHGSDNKEGHGLSNEDKACQRHPYG